jgi:non-homologous end joining protein Ku
MAPRSFWKGYLELSLVICPVAMMPATRACAADGSIQWNNQPSTLSNPTGHMRLIVL